MLFLLAFLNLSICIISMGTHRANSFSGKHYRKRDGTSFTSQDQRSSQYVTMEMQGYFLPKYSGWHDFSLYASSDATLQFGTEDKCVDSAGDSVKNTIAIRASLSNSYSALLQAGLYYPLKIVLLYDFDGESFLDFKFREPHGNFSGDLGDYIFQMGFKIGETIHYSNVDPLFQPGCQPSEEKRRGFMLTTRNSGVESYSELEDDFFVDRYKSLKTLGGAYFLDTINFDTGKPQNRPLKVQKAGDFTEEPSIPVWYFKPIPTQQLKIYYDEDEEAEQADHRTIMDMESLYEGIPFDYSDPASIYSSVEDFGVIEKSPSHVYNTGSERKPHDTDETDWIYSDEDATEWITDDNHDTTGFDMFENQFVAESLIEMPQSDQPFESNLEYVEDSDLTLSEKKEDTWKVQPIDYHVEEWDFEQLLKPDEDIIQDIVRGDQPPDEDPPYDEIFFYEQPHEDLETLGSSLESSFQKELEESIQKSNEDSSLKVLDIEVPEDESSKFQTPQTNNENLTQNNFIDHLLATVAEEDESELTAIKSQDDHQNFELEIRPIFGKENNTLFTQREEKIIQKENFSSKNDFFLTSSTEEVMNESNIATQNIPAEDSTEIHRKSSALNESEGNFEKTKGILFLKNIQALTHNSSKIKYNDSKNAIQKLKESKWRPTKSSEEKDIPGSHLLLSKYSKNASYLENDKSSKALAFVSLIYEIASPLDVLPSIIEDFSTNGQARSNSMNTYQSGHSTSSFSFSTSVKSIYRGVSIEHQVAVIKENVSNSQTQAGEGYTDSPSSFTAQLYSVDQNLLTVLGCSSELNIKLLVFLAFLLGVFF